MAILSSAILKVLFYAQGVRQLIFVNQQNPKGFNVDIIYINVI